MTAPLVPADVEIRDFEFMPLDVARLRDSELAANETPEACWAAVLLWCASWHQVPAASIPDDEQWIAKTCGYVSRGRVDPAWKRVRPGALRGWVRCDDGRLYHPVVAEKALQAWRSKLQQRWKTECARLKKSNQRHGTNVRLPDFDEWLSLGCPPGHAAPVPRDTAGTSPRSPDETRSKGQGEGQGQGQERANALAARAPEPAAAQAIEDEPPVAPTRAGELSRLLRALGVRSSPSDPNLLALADAGVSDAELADAVEAAKRAKGEAPGLRYVLGVVRGRRNDATRLATMPPPGSTGGFVSAREARIQRDRAWADELIGRGPEAFDGHVIDVTDDGRGAATGAPRITQ